MVVFIPQRILRTFQITKIARIHIVKRSLILPTLLHHFVFEYATQYHYPTITENIIVVIKVIAVVRFGTGTGGQHIDVFVLAVFAEEYPIAHVDSLC